MRGVSIITSTIKPQFADNIFNNYERQNWEEKELIIILNKDSLKEQWWKRKAKEYHNVSVYQLPEDLTLGECLNFGTEKARYPYVAKFDDDDYYAPGYLAQAMEAFKKTDAVLVGKRSVYTYFQKEKVLVTSHRSFENQYIKKVMRGGTIVFDKSIFPQIQFPAKNISEDVGIQRQCVEHGFKMYATDRNNYVYMRHADETHTSHKKNQDIIHNNKFIAQTDLFQKYISDSP